MELEVERALEKKYQELILHQMETRRIIESLNSLLPEAERFNIMASGEALDKLVEEAREKAIRAVLEPYKNSNVSINVKEISKELDKLCNKCFSIKLHSIRHKLKFMLVLSEFWSYKHNNNLWSKCNRTSISRRLKYLESLYK